MGVSMDNKRHGTNGARRYCSSFFIVLVFLTACPPAGRQEKKAPSPPSPQVGVADSEIGLSKTSVFDTPAPPQFQYNQSEPGESQVLPRAYPGAPPLIPHEVSELLPITREDNACLDCHAADEGDSAGPPPIPQSHYIDMRGAPGVVRETIAGARFVCTTCHVPQATLSPIVGNGFDQAAPR